MPLSLGTLASASRSGTLARFTTRHPINLTTTPSLDRHFYDGPLGNKNDLWARANVLGADMECSTLLTMAGYHRVRAAAILVVDNYIFERLDRERQQTGGYEPYRKMIASSLERSVEITLDALASVPDFTARPVFSSSRTNPTS